jgi:hypothetical protein
MSESTNATRKNALLSACGYYRYWLSREWDDSLPIVTFIMMNPSTADAFNDDATIRKCVGFAKAWGFGRIRVVNLFALRSREPLDLFGDFIYVFCESCAHGWTQLDGEYTGPRPCEKCGSLSTTEVDAPWNPIGPDNDAVITGVLADSTHVLAAWGCEGTLRKKAVGKSLRERPAQVIDLVQRVRPDLPISCLGMSKNGTPYHPLMLAYTTPRIPFEVTA